MESDIRFMKRVKILSLALMALSLWMEHPWWLCITIIILALLAPLAAYFAQNYTISFISLEDYRKGGKNVRV
ncbi:MAG: hypothetical protein WC449_03435 [Candidatus Paceibacterota bacterium]